MFLQKLKKILSAVDKNIFLSFEKMSSHKIGILETRIDVEKCKITFRIKLKKYVG